MIALLLALSAPGLAGEPGTFERLFGEPTATPAAAAEEPGPSSPPWWALPVALGGACAYAATHLRRRRGGRSATEGMRIVQRQVLGDRSTLVLVEVEDAGGARRRLLVGTGTGAPSLVADLGPVTADSAQPVAPASQPVAVTAPVAALPSREEATVHATALVSEVLAERATVPAEAAVAEDDVEEAFFSDAAPEPTRRPRFFTEDDLAPVTAETRPPAASLRDRVARIAGAEARRAPGRLEPIAGGRADDARSPLPVRRFEAVLAASGGRR